MTTTTIITASLPGTHDWLRDLAQAIRTTRHRHPQLNLKWIVVWDGPARHDDADPYLHAADAIVLTQPERRGEGAARNRALFSPHVNDTDFIVPMDADDLMDPAGLAATITDLTMTGYRWAAANRTLLNGDRTPHWHNHRTWARGEVADTWSSPLAFHPNSIVTTAALARAVGGWPDLPANADLLFAMRCNEAARGISVPHILTRYRVWDSQVVNQPAYPEQKAAAFAHIVATLNTAREGTSAPPITAPTPGRAPGTVAVDTPPLEHWDMPTAWRYATTHGDHYLASGLITATRLTADYPWTTSHGAPMLGKSGDWHASNDLDEWTIEHPLFEQTYTHVAGDHYRKHVPVSAVQILHPITCDTIEGPAPVPAGDWLIASTTNTDAWPVRAAAFWDRYPDGPIIRASTA